MIHNKLKSTFTYGDFKSKYYYRFKDERTKNYLIGSYIIIIFDKHLNKQLTFNETFTVMTPYSVMDKYLSEYLTNERNEKISSILST